MNIFKIIAFAMGLASMAQVHAHYNPYPPRAGHYNSGWSGRIDQRQLNLQKRIAQNSYLGHLSPQEIKELRRRQHDIDRLEQRFKRDGRLSRREKAVLNRKLHHASRPIHVLKQNKHDAFRRHYDYGYNRYRY
ncbi:MAG: hypothetical protein ACU84H_04895 [Gammaproteobacteria bacterium]